MRVVIAPDSFKESMSAVEAAMAMAAGVHGVHPDAECIQVPMADGGEGFAATVAAAVGGTHKAVTVTGALGSPVTGAVHVCGRRAVLDAASAVGLELQPAAERDLWNATSRGVGELLRAALDHDVDEIVVGLGGSSTNDGGAGMLVGLGGRLSDVNGRPLDGSPASLRRVAHIDVSGLDPRLGRVRLTVAVDVDNPLLGPEGASATFGPQKGASPADVRWFDEALARWAAVLDPCGLTVDQAGSGAAGGLGFALARLGAVAAPGAELVASLVDLRGHVDGADLVLTGEGRIDGQTLRGKTPLCVASVAHEAGGVPVVGFAGIVGDDAALLLDHGFAELVQITPQGTPRGDALRQGPENLRRAVARAVRHCCRDGCVSAR